MTAGKIIEKAETHASLYFNNRFNVRQQVIDAYIAGAHSRDEEINHWKESYEELAEIAADLQTEKQTLMIKNVKLCNPWISVEDRLPELNKICFGMRDGKMPRICMLVKKKNGECVFNTPNEEYEYPKGKITHWMPVPELPKGGDKC